MLPLRDSQSSGRFPIVTFLLIAINVFVFYLEITAADPEAFISQYALIPSQLDFSNPGTWRPFLTSMFLHAGFVHIISNMWFLWIFGDNVEDRLGLFYLPFYLLSGVVGSFAQLIFMRDSAIPMLGASGAIAGVLGAYLVLFPRNTVSTLVPVFGFATIVNLPASAMLFYWFFTQLFSSVASIAVMTGETGGVAYMAHLGGFLSGWFGAQFFKSRPGGLDRFN
jgi:membrane associated rhomboid family serine protease